MSGVAAMLMAAVSAVEPTFLAAGAGAIDSTGAGSVDVPYPASIGGTMLLHVVAIGTAPSIDTPSGWTLLDGQTSNDGTYASSLFGKQSAGESGSLTVTSTSDGDTAGRIYSFNGGSGFEAQSGAKTNTSGTALVCVNLTTLGPKRCAVQAFTANVATSIGAVTGESNADYTEAVAEYTAAGGPLILSLQTASVPTATAISGGQATLGAAGINRQRHGVAIIP